ncbi:SDR family oxidoreductase [Micromonospora chersina]|uniref:SDR family oxidoreductase n=1 Tax=Micromonospora chersina TaxID=47854 RepID=UPI0033DFBCD4
MTTSRPLAGQVALITGSGSSSGIGFACARRLGLLGARVALTSTTERVRLRAAELAAAGIPATAHVADLTDSDQASDLVAAAVAEHGPVTVLVNNAGMRSLTSPESLVPAAVRRDPIRGPGWWSLTPPPVHIEPSPAAAMAAAEDQHVLVGDQV